MNNNGEFVDDSKSENRVNIDFTEFESEISNANKEKKEKIVASVEMEKKEINENNKNKKKSNAANKLKEAIDTPETESKMKSDQEPSETFEESEKPAKEEIKDTKKDSPLIIEEDDNKRRAETIMTEDDDEDDDKILRSIITSQDPKARSHRVITEDEKEEDKNNFIIDTESKEKIISEQNEKEKEEMRKEDEKRKKVEKIIQKRTGYEIFGGEDGIACILASDNPNIKALKEFDIPTDKIKPIANSDEKLKQSFLEQYITLSNAKDSTVVDHRISRFPLLLSGYYAEMTDYSMGELTSVIRNIRNTEIKFARKFQEELVSLYNHISWTSLKTEGDKLTFEEWLKATKFQDLDMFYFGAYDATYPGLGTYRITCGNCGSTFEISKKNRALSYLLQNGKDPILKDTFIRDVLIEKTPVNELKKTLIYSKANTPYDEKVLKPHNIKVTYNCPSLLDILEYLTVFEELLGDDVEDFEAIIDDTIDGHNVLTMYSFIKSIIVPVNKGKNADGKNVISFFEVSTDVEDAEERMNNRRYIIKILKDLPTDEFTQLFQGKELAERKNLKGITHILHNIKCTSCSSNISRITIDMRVNFFMRTATAVDRIDQY